MSIREDADRISRESILKVLPDQAVAEALRGKTFSGGRLVVAAAGKAAWQMAKAASDLLGDRIDAGVVVTKYGHVKGEIPRMLCLEAGHPVPDKNSFAATEAVLKLTGNLTEKDTVLFLLSGGGSALFEKPLIPEEELLAVTRQLLACGAGIVEINTIRKRLSGVKGGKFARHCQPARIFSIVLSDVLGDPLDMIASGPAYPDSSTSREAFALAEKYGLLLSAAAQNALSLETPKILSNVETRITGSVKELCQAAASSCRMLGYEPFILADQLNCQAKEAGSFLAAVARSHQSTRKSLAFLAGGETVVHLTGAGKGGRSQELALAAAEGISGLKDTAVFSFGSDGTDGPTDAAGGFCDGNTRDLLLAQGMEIYRILRDNDAYCALKKTGGLIFTGPTGTNVNDLAAVLIRR